MSQCPFRDWDVGGPRGELSNTPATRFISAARYPARALPKKAKMKLSIGPGLYAGLAAGSMSPEAEASLLAENDARMRRLYHGLLYDDLITLQRRGYVVVWHRHPKTLSLDGRHVSVAAFKALACRERRIAARTAPADAIDARAGPTTPPPHHAAQ